MPSFYIVDDDPQILKLASALLEQAGHQVWSSTSSIKALNDVPAKRPDCVLVDIMMPELDGLQLCKALRASSELAASKIIVVSAKTYEFDRNRARDVGVDGYLTKPIDPESFVETIEKIISNRVVSRFWGVRGTLPVPGERTLRYGGNTSCVSLSFENSRLFIFDAGSGIKELSNHLVASGAGRLSARIFITHPHWDHINALPHFAPLYSQGNDFEIFGPAGGERGIRDLVAAQMDGVFFPITMREFGAHVVFRDLQEQTLVLDGIEVKTMLLSHPGNCLGYRVNYGQISVCYVTDNELFPEDLPQHNPAYVKRLVEFVQGADVLITDATYTDEEYANRIGWGHSAVSRVAELAHRAEVKALHLFHHDPEQDDDAIDAKLHQGRRALDRLNSKTECIAPAEGDTLQL